MRHAIVGLLALGLAAHARAQVPDTPSPIFKVGEELQYAVRWKFIRLGTIIVRTVEDSTSTDTGRVRCVMIVESSPGLPVVSLQEHNESVMDIMRIRSLSFAAVHLMNGHSQTIHHSFKPEDRVVTAELVEGEHEQVVKKTIPDVDWYVEGVSLFFYARHVARRGGVFEAPTLVNLSIARTTLRIDSMPEELSIEAWDPPIRAHRFTGRADWSGASAAGVTGDFTGWTSDDEASVMLRAELDISLGSIDVELERWRRDGWRPPSPVSAARR
jgi:hypothetical protein